MTAARDIRFVVRLAVLAALAAAALAFTQVADASYILARNATGVSLKTNLKGDMALVTYRDSRGWHRVLAWGAVNAPTSPQNPQTVAVAPLSTVDGLPERARQSA